MRKTVLTIFVTLIVSSTLLGQVESLSGIVIDSLTQAPLPFTNVGVVDREIGSISNSEGNYTLSLHDIALDDTLFFSFVGYENRKYPVSQLIDDSKVLLSKSTVQLSDFSVLSREYTPEEIVGLMKDSFSINHATSNVRQQMFHRRSSFTTIHNSDIKCKKTSFDAFDKQFIADLNEELPEELNSYSDYLVDVLYTDTASTLVPIEGQSLVENWDFDEEFNDRLQNSVDVFEEDLANDSAEAKNYFKARSGVIGGRVDITNDTASSKADDSLYYIKTTENVKRNLNELTAQSAIVDSKQLDFFENYKLYNYTLQDISVVNGELAYVISFVPDKRKGKYAGTICVGTENFALLQVDYAYAEGKTGRDISLLGLAYLELGHSGRVIFERGESAYYLKYFSDETNQRFGVDRGLTLKQKHDGKLRNKTLQEIKLHVDFDITSVSRNEVLVVSQQTITQEEFDMTVQPDTMKLKKVSVYAPGIWENSSIIEPTKALKAYERQF